jgi:CelD/BcsL family acetyltransferase involved in cellulose biosynthesis
VTAAPTVEVIADLDALEGLAPEWWALWRRAPGATPFGSPAWLIPWWRHFHPGALWTVAVRSEGALVGLAALYLEDGLHGRRLLPVGISLSDYCDVLLDPACAKTAAAAIVAQIESRSALWDGWDLEELAPDAAALALPVPAGCDESLTPQNACPVLALDQGLTAIPKRKTRKLRMARHRVERRQPAEIISVQPENASDFFQELLRLHGARWERRGEAGVLADDAVQRFHADAIAPLGEAGLLRLFLLRIEGVTAGAYYGFHHGTRAYAYLGGFDPAFTFESPGTVLMGHAIEQALSEGAHEFHFLRGQEPYKYEWGAVDRWNQRRSFRRRARHD